MFGAKTRVATHINKIESNARLSHCHGHALHLVVGETIKAIKIIRDTLEAPFEFEFNYFLKRQKASNRLREETALARSFQ